MASGPIDWSRVALVVFDVDGTLYAQRPLRLRMARSLVLRTLMRADWRTAAILGSYRRMREEFCEAETEDFDNRLVDQVAARHAVPPATVRAIVAEWMEERPLPALARTRYRYVDRLFERIRASGRQIGVLSDYPAERKLAAMGLRADVVVCAGDVGILKPHPRGLERVMALACVGPAQTIMVGDRAERDGAAAARAGVACLLRSAKPIAGARTFARFDDAVFDGLDMPLQAAA